MLRVFVFALGILFSGQVAAAPALVFCSDASPDGFDSALSDTAATHRAAAYPIYNRLVGYAPGSAKLVPELAESWVESNGGRVWTFTLRHGVAFQHTAWFAPTRTFNADDVLWSVLRQIDPQHPGAAEAPAGFPGAVAGGWAKLIKSVERIDDYTVRFALNEPYAPFPGLMASWPFSIVSAEYGAQLAATGKLAQMATEPVGTGPYQLAKYERGSAIRYAAHGGYFRGAPAIDKLIFSITPDPTVRVQKLHTGECSLVESVKPQDIAALSRDARVTVREYHPQFTSFLAFNARHKPFDDARVRRALSLAIDRRVIARAVFDGHARPGWLPYAPDSLWGAPEVAAPEPDAEAARKLLSEAGYPDGFATTIWAASGGGQNNANPRLTAELIQADWAKIGVRGSVVTMDAAELGRRGRKGEHDTIISGWRNSLDPDELYANLLTCQASASSTAHWCDADFDKLIEDARETPDLAARTRDYEQAAQRFLGAAPWAVLAYPTAAVVYSSKLTGVEPSSAMPFSFEHLRWK